MLKRAGELFAILTGGSFETLQLEFDHDDKVHLLACGGMASAYVSPA
jgi:hypothetical protein